MDVSRRGIGFPPPFPNSYPTIPLSSTRRSINPIVGWLSWDRNRETANNKPPVVMYYKNLSTMFANPWFLFEQAVFICSSVSSPSCLIKQDYQLPSKLTRCNSQCISFSGCQHHGNKYHPNISRVSNLHLSSLSCLHLKTSVLRWMPGLLWGEFPTWKLGSKNGSTEDKTTN